MNILVTGGAGYIGSHTVLELVAAGHRPVIVDNFANSSRAVVDRLQELTGADITCYEQDFQDHDKLQDVIRKEKIDGVIHFAAFKAVGDSMTDPLRYYSNNTAGFIGLLRDLLDCGVYTVIFSSTAAVYGNPPADIVTEETVCAPESPYGWSKYMDEIILRDTCHAEPRLSGTALRYFNVVGAHESGDLGEQSKDRPQNLLPIIVQATAGKLPPLTVLGTDYPTPDGTCLRDYIHVVDLAKAHVAALAKAAQPISNAGDADEDTNKDTGKGGFNVYNVSTGSPTSVLELIKTFESVNDVKVPHTLGDRRSGDPVAYYSTAEKAQKELGWKAEKTIEDACRDAWRWQTKHPDGFSS